MVAVKPSAPSSGTADYGRAIADAETACCHTYRLSDLSHGAYHCTEERRMAGSAIRSLSSQANPAAALLTLGEQLLTPERHTVKYVPSLRSLSSQISHGAYNCTEQRRMAEQLLTLKRHAVVCTVSQISLTVECIIAQKTGVWQSLPYGRCQAKRTQQRHC
jgi:hypothetical protein